MRYEKPLKGTLNKNVNLSYIETLNFYNNEFVTHRENIAFVSDKVTKTQNQKGATCRGIWYLLWHVAWCPDTMRLVLPISQETERWVMDGSRKANDASERGVAEWERGFTDSGNGSDVEIKSGPQFWCCQFKSSGIKTFRGTFLCNKVIFGGRKKKKTFRQIRYGINQLNTFL